MRRYDTETWILAIRYMEAPSRGMTPLTEAQQCSCGASGAGSCSCGAGRKPCGCGGMTVGAEAAAGQTIAPASS